MGKTVIPKDYKSALNIYETQRAIGLLKRLFEDNLSAALNLRRVSAPLFVSPDSGINDDLSGVERAVRFDIPSMRDDGVIVHSLAKWKRVALADYHFHAGEGLYTDMNAIRRDEVMDNLHSIYVDQWDWEKIITKEDRTMDTLKSTVTAIVGAIKATERAICAIFPKLSPVISEEINFITSQELEDLYPNLDSKARENEYIRSHPTTFLMQIGDTLKSGKPHDRRAPDYDDWTLNGDLLFYHPTLDLCLEISSMGVRVDETALERQLTLADCENRRELPFHKMLLNGKLPYTIGGGIGQSRLCLLLLNKAHVGEVQVSLWDDETFSSCKSAGITLL